MKYKVSFEIESDEIKTTIEYAIMDSLDNKIGDISEVLIEEIK